MQKNANGTAAAFLFSLSREGLAYLFIYKQKGMISVSGKEGVGFA